MVENLERDFVRLGTSFLSCFHEILCSRTPIFHETKNCCDYHGFAKIRILRPVRPSLQTSQGCRLKLRPQLERLQFVFRVIFPNPKLVIGCVHLQATVRIRASHHDPGSWALLFNVLVGDVRSCALCLFGEKRVVYSFIKKNERCLFILSIIYALDNSCASTSVEFRVGRWVSMR